MSIYEKRVKHLNRFSCGMADIQILRNPLSLEVIVVFNDISYNHYQDSQICESERVKKIAVVKKNPEMSYVQELGDVLLEDDPDKIPWIVSMTTTGLSRIPKFNDHVVIEGIKYTISKVKPVNRNIDSLINIFIYPERNDPQDLLSIIDIKFLDSNEEITTKQNEGKTIIDILYGGFPKKMSFDDEHWFDFRSRIKFEQNTNGSFTLNIDDQNIEISDLNFLYLSDGNDIIKASL